jgi:hypothetical protein
MLGLWCLGYTLDDDGTDAQRWEKVVRRSGSARFLSASSPLRVSESREVHTSSCHSFPFSYEYKTQNEYPDPFVVESILGVIQRFIFSGPKQRLVVLNNNISMDNLFSSNLSHLQHTTIVEAQSFQQDNN